MDEKIECPYCGYEVSTKNDGMRLKVHNVNGERCEGSDASVEELTAPADGAETNADEPESGESSNDTADESEDAESESDESEDDTEQKIAASMQSDETKTFTFRMTVRGSNPYLATNDRYWHFQNGEMAKRKAMAAGHIPAADAEHVDTEKVDGDYVVTYEVPIHY